MTGNSGINVTGGVLAVGLAVAFAGLAFFVLAQIARPADFSSRLGRADARVAEAQAVLNEPGPPHGYIKGAVCDDAGAAAGLLKARIQSEAAAVGITVASVSATPAPPGQDGVPLTAVSLQFEASGRYDALLAMMEALARQTPSVFVETADLSSQVSSVNFKFSGRIYCSARP